MRAASNLGRFKQPAPVLLAVDSHHADESAHRDIAYRLLRRSPWPVLAEPVKLGETRSLRNY
jgi:hypothetical protein